MILNLIDQSLIHPWLMLENESLDMDYSIRKTIHYQPPTSMGFSFYADNKLEYIRVFYCASSFDKKSKTENNMQAWEKKSLVDQQGEEISVPLKRSSVHNIMNGFGQLSVIIRPHMAGKIITVTLLNIKKIETAESHKEFRDCLAVNSMFEVQLKCYIDSKNILNYPRVNNALLTEEEQELELRYRDERIYAIGHGVAVDWEINNEQIVLFSDFMPIVEVPIVTANTGKNELVLNFAFLSEITTNVDVLSKLEKFIDDYEDWILDQVESVSTKLNDDKEVEQRLLSRMEQAKQRMRTSLTVLKNDENIKIAFSLANKAMLKQMESNGKAPFEKPYAWRPFQLAFFLMVLESVSNENSDFRDCVDLIWFPTGGGKTEAYLGVMAFTFILRRLTYTSSGGGTATIMRYSLRLLTTQQFIRACKLIAALEIIRREQNNLGSEPFSAGLWLGSSSSPNNYSDAAGLYSKNVFDKFILTECVWCNTKFGKNNYIVSDVGFNFKCNHKDCELGRGGSVNLPFNVVDEALYENPPTLLIATIDKFARLPWEDKAVAFFGGNKNRPPELIIQDELHLISGALGSIAGLYEVGFEATLLARGSLPKIIASTATIRQASDQVKCLFGRQQMAIFPPVGFRQKDSYFAREVPISEKPGRLYIGYMAFGRKRVDSLIDLAAALLVAPTACFDSEVEMDLFDAWWTLMVYHGSLKSLGISRTNFDNGIRKKKIQFSISEIYQRLKSAGLIQESGSIDKIMTLFNEINSNPDQEFEVNESLKIYKRFSLSDREIKTLTGNQTANENATVFEKLKLKNNENNAINVVLATNMVSVGLDEPRLALMIINGQPLTTAEYIQASSRVGRGSIPGIVFTNYSKTQATSLSHYENFRAYHRSFYRYVEPSSLTPFTRQVRKRALHAAFVLAVRHMPNGLLKNADAEKFSMDNPKIKEILKIFKLRIKNALIGTFENREKLYQECLADLDTLGSQWEDEISRSTNLRYRAHDNSANSLLIQFEDAELSSGLWLTLNSMRNVESTGLFELRG